MTDFSWLYMSQVRKSYIIWLITVGRAGPVDMYSQLKSIFTNLKGFRFQSSSSINKSSSNWSSPDPEISASAVRTSCT